MTFPYKIAPFFLNLFTSTPLIAQVAPSKATMALEKK
jgi:hypothetical protein